MHTGGGRGLSEAAQERERAVVLVVILAGKGRWGGREREREREREGRGERARKKWKRGGDGERERERELTKKEGEESQGRKYRRVIVWLECVCVCRPVVDLEDDCPKNPGRSAKTIPLTSPLTLVRSSPSIHLPPPPACPLCAKQRDQEKGEGENQEGRRKRGRRTKEERRSYCCIRREKKRRKKNDKPTGGDHRHTRHLVTFSFNPLPHPPLPIQSSHSSLPCSPPPLIPHTHLHTPS